MLDPPRSKCLLRMYRHLANTSAAPLSELRQRMWRLQNVQADSKPAQRDSLGHGRVACRESADGGSSVSGHGA